MGCACKGSSKVRPKNIVKKPSTNVSRRNSSSGRIIRRIIK